MFQALTLEEKDILVIYRLPAPSFHARSEGEKARPPKKRVHLLTSVKPGVLARL